MPRRAGACSACPTPTWGCCPRWTATTWWSWAAAPATCRRGWRGGAPGSWSALTRRRRSWRRRRRCSGGRRCRSRSFGATRRCSRSPTPRSTSPSPSTAPPSGATPTAGCPRRPACCGPAAGSSSWATPRCSCCACRTRTACPPASGCCDRSGACTGSSGPTTPASSSTSRTATCSGRCGPPASRSRSWSRCTRRAGATTRYPFVDAAWAERWPVEEVWVARKRP